MKNEALVIERSFNVTIEKLWRAITDKDQMKEWYFDLADFKPEPGFEFTFSGGTEEKTYLHISKITEVDPGKKLTYSWRYDGYEGNSFVTFELFPESSRRTTLKLTHSGLETFPTSNPDLSKDNFAAGWNEIIGNSLRKFIETGYIKKTVQINAPASKVWQVLTENEGIKQWASAFGEGTYVETDWKTGSAVIWKDAEGNVGAKGIVDTNDNASYLKVRFYDDVENKPGDPIGEYYESYSINGTEGKTILTIESGPLPLKHLELHEPLWEKALENIRVMAEGEP